MSKSRIASFSKGLHPIVLLVGAGQEPSLLELKAWIALVRHQVKALDHQDLCLLWSMEPPLILLSSGSGAAPGWRLMLFQNTRKSLSSHAKPALRTEEEVLL